MNERLVEEMAIGVSAVKITKADVVSKPDFLFGPIPCFQMPAADFSSFSKQMVAFRIGQNLDEFVVHKAYAVKHSKVLEAAFNSEMIEGQTQIYTLDDVSPHVFRYVVRWMYHEDLTLPVYDKSKPGVSGEERSHMAKCRGQDNLLIQLWVLADKFGIAGLADAVINHLLKVQEICGPLHAGCYAYIYQNTLTDCPLRRLALDQAAWIMPAYGMERNLGLYPPDMLRDLALLYAKQAPEVIRTRKVAAMTAENYHISKAPL